MAHSPILFGPNSTANNLQSNLGFNNGIGPSILTGSAVPSVTATAGVSGSIYLCSSNGTVYVKQDNGSSTNWLAVGAAALTPTRQVFTASGSGTYTAPTPTPLYLKVTVVGGGGGGGGTGTVAQAAGGGGGGGGGVVIGYIASPATSYSYSIGSGGAGGATSSAGVTGGTSSFGTSLFSATGGQGGASSNTTLPSGVGLGGSGGVGSGGSTNVAGQGGGPGIPGLGGTANGTGGTGGGNTYGGGSVGGMNAPGSPGQNYGAGGGGGGGASQSGGAGSSGYILVEEYYGAAATPSTALNGTLLNLTEISTPSNPAASTTDLYAKSDGNLFTLINSGVENQIASNYITLGTASTVFGTASTAITGSPADPLGYMFIQTGANSNTSLNSGNTLNMVLTTGVAAGTPGNILIYGGANTSTGATGSVILGNVVSGAILSVGSGGVGIAGQSNSTTVLGISASPTTTTPYLQLTDGNGNQSFGIFQSGSSDPSAKMLMQSQASHTSFNGPPVYRLQIITDSAVDTDGFMMATGDGHAYQAGTGSLRINPSNAATNIAELTFNNNAGMQITSNNALASSQYAQILANINGLSINSPKIGFYSATPVVQQTGGAATAGTTYTTVEQGMINRMYTALRALGLIT